MKNLKPQGIDTWGARHWNRARKQDSTTENSQETREGPEFSMSTRFTTPMEDEAELHGTRRNKVQWKKEARVHFGKYRPTLRHIHRLILSNSLSTPYQKNKI